MNAEPPSAEPCQGKSRSDRYVKMAFVLVGVIIVGALLVRQHIGVGLKGWPEDLDGVLKRAAQENRSVVVFLYESRKDSIYKKMRDITLSKKGNFDAMKDLDLLWVASRSNEDDPFAAKYKVTEFPTTLLIGGDGAAITSWRGYIGETDYRQRFLKGEPQNR